MNYDGLEEHHVFTMNKETQLVLVRQGAPGTMDEAQWYIKLHRPDGDDEPTQNLTEPLAEAGLELRSKLTIARAERHILIAAAVVRRNQDVESAAQHLVKAIQLLSGDSVETIAGRFRDLEVELQADPSHLAQELKE